MSNNVYKTPNRPIKRKMPIAPTAPIKNKISRHVVPIPFPSLDSITPCENIKDKLIHCIALVYSEKIINYKTGCKESEKIFYC